MEVLRVNKNKNFRRFHKKNRGFSKLSKIEFWWRQILENFIIHELSLGSHGIPQKIWDRSVQSLIGNKQTNSFLVLTAYQIVWDFYSNFHFIFRGIFRQKNQSLAYFLIFYQKSFSKTRWFVLINRRRLQSPRQKETNIVSLSSFHWFLLTPVFNIQDLSCCQLSTVSSQMDSSAQQMKLVKERLLSSQRILKSF